MQHVAMSAATDYEKKTDTTSRAKKTPSVQQPQYAPGFALAYDTWVSQGSGLRSGKDGAMRYNKGPMRGLTRDEAMSMFRNQVWQNAAPKWKQEYERRATSDMMAPPAAPVNTAATTTAQPAPAAAPAAPTPITQPKFGQRSNIGGNSMTQPSFGSRAGTGASQAGQRPLIADRKGNATMIDSKGQPAIMDTPGNVAASQMRAPNNEVLGPKPIAEMSSATPTVARPQIATKKERGEAPRPATPASGASFLGAMGAALADTSRPYKAETEAGKTDPAYTARMADRASGAFTGGAPKASPVEEPKPFAPQTPQTAAQPAAKTPITKPQSVMPQSPMPARPAATISSDEVLTNEDMSAKGYTLIGSRSGQKKWRKGAAMDNANATAEAKTNENLRSSPITRAIAPTRFEGQLETKSVMGKSGRSRITKTSESSNPEYDAYDAAATRIESARMAGSLGDEADLNLAQKYESQFDGTGAQENQRERVRAEEKAGFTQAGRYVGPDRNSPEYRSKINAITSPRRR